MSKNIWLDGMMGLVTGDALGNPVQFMSRAEVRRRGPVVEMEAGGAFDTPAGTWTDDSSMALATLVSLRKHKKVVPADIMQNFVDWDIKGKYTPFGRAFDQGITCTGAIRKFLITGDPKTCGRTGEHANGNGALMRILPVCLFYAEKTLQAAKDEKPQAGVTAGEAACGSAAVSDREAVESIHEVTALTHNHLRAKIASGLYYFMVKSIVAGGGTLPELLQKGMDAGLAYYRSDPENLSQLPYFARLYHLDELAAVPEDQIRSSGYVLDSIEAAVWSLVTTEAYREALIKAVNLGDDADTVGAIAGGLAGLYYGMEGIPGSWLEALQKREWIEELCRREEQ